MVSECEAEQTLRCPLSSKHTHLQRVWCKREETDHNCCVGLSFGSEVTELDGGSVSVRDDGTAFIVSIKSLSQGDGVYWCGYWNGSNTIIKVAEKKFHSESDIPTREKSEDSVLYIFNNNKNK